MNKNFKQLATNHIITPAKSFYSAIKSAFVAMCVGCMIALMAVSYIQRDSISKIIKTKYNQAINKTVEVIRPSDEDGTSEKEKEDQRIGEYVLFIMNFSNVKMSDFQKQLLAQTIVRVSGNIFDTEEERMDFVVLINNESRFDKNAKSPAGAVGLTQVMPQFISEFAGHCGLEINANEATDTETNLTLGACRFKHLLTSYKGVYSTALAAYNAGKYAKSVKELQSLAKMTNPETLQYIVRFTHVKATADAYFRNKKQILADTGSETKQIN